MSVSPALSQIQIGLIPDQEGQMLRNKLMDRFYQEGIPNNSTYSLQITPIQEQLRDLDITITSDTTRSQMKLTSSLVLTDLSTNQVVLRRSLKALSIYNVLGSEFATRVTERNARENAIEDMARQIERALVLYFQTSSSQQDI